MTTELDDNDESLPACCVRLTQPPTSFMRNQNHRKPPLNQQSIECGNNCGDIAVLRSVSIPKGTKVPDRKRSMNPPPLEYIPPLENIIEQFMLCFSSQDNISFGRYGSDAKGSVFQSVNEENVTKESTGWDLRQIAAYIKKKFKNTEFEGVKGFGGYLYFGAPYTFFPCHTEDCDFFSVNYLASGAPKLWFFVEKKTP